MPDKITFRLYSEGGRKISDMERFIAFKDGINLDLKNNEELIKLNRVMKKRILIF